jgi:hypothetical protein
MRPYTVRHKRVLITASLKPTKHPISCWIAPHSPHIMATQSAITGAAKGMRARETCTAPGTSLAHKSAVECALAAEIWWCRREQFHSHARTLAFHISLQNYRPALGLNKKERYARRALLTRLDSDDPPRLSSSPSQCSRARVLNKKTLNARRLLSNSLVAARSARRQPENPFLLHSLWRTHTHT